jgi:hypothetical protein
MEMRITMHDGEEAGVNGGASENEPSKRVADQ